jgi:probable addiction module antidote protein
LPGKKTGRTFVILAATRPAGTALDRIMTDSTLSRFDAADYLDSPAARAEYLSAALETGDMAFILDGINVIARAEGMPHIAQAASAGRTSLYKTLQPGGNPDFATILRVLDALGVRLTARPADVDPDENDTVALVAGLPPP